MNNMIETTVLSRRHIEQLKRQAPERGIEWEVLNWLDSSTSDANEATEYLLNLINRGSISGSGSMIYYNQTLSFYEKHRVECHQMVGDYQQDVGELPLNIGDYRQFSNQMAWFCFDYAAFLLADKIGLEA